MTRHILTDGTKSIELSQYPDSAWTYLTGKPDGDEIDLSKIFRRVAWANRAVTLRGAAMADIPFTIYDKAGNEYDNSEGYENKLQILPNPTELFRKLEESLCIYGFAYVLKLSNTFQFVKELKYLAPTSITPVVDKATGAITFTRRTDREYTFTADQMMYFWLPDPDVELGPPMHSPLKAAFNACAALYSLDDFMGKYFSRGMIKATILSVQGNPPEPERNRLKQMWADLMNGVASAWKSLVFNMEKMSPVVVGEGLENVRSDKLTASLREDVSTGCGVPQSLLFSNAANFATAISDTKNLYTQTIVPDANFIAEIFNKQLLEPLGGYSIEFDHERLEIFSEEEADRSGSLANLTDEKLPLIMAIDVLNIDITDEQRAELVALDADRKAKAEAAKLAAEEAQKVKDELPPQNVPGNPVPVQESVLPEDAKDDLNRWQRKAIKAVEKGDPLTFDFVSQFIPDTLRASVEAGLAVASNADEVKAVFSEAIQKYCAPDSMALLLAEMRRANDLLERENK